MMKQKRVLILGFGLAALVLLFGFFTPADDPLKKILAQLERWTNDYPQEKVYLHLDKPYYAAGDNIWFKAYVTIGPRHQVSALSSILNVELVDDRDSVKQFIRLPLSNGVSQGDFVLSDSLRAGTYRIRAYTNWMRNFSEAYFYNQPVLIGNALTDNVLVAAAYTYNPQQTRANLTYTSTSQAPYAGNEVSYEVKLDGRTVARDKGITDAQGRLAVSFPNNGAPGYRTGQIITRIKTGDKKPAVKTLIFHAASQQTDVQFFPEGGTLVNGLSSTVAFKAVGANGLGADVTGRVLDNDNRAVATLQSRHLGMGSFTLRPEPGKTYHAELTYPDGSSRTLSLPQAQSSGYVLSISDAGDNLRAVIMASRDLLNQGQAGQLSLVGQANGVVCYGGQTRLSNNTFTATIPKSRFPMGIAQFTLFAADNSPVAERLIFVRNNADLIQMNVSSAAATYGPRQQVRINLHAQDNAGKPLMGAFSAAVINESLVPVNESDESTILSHILLTSDLQGYVEQPGYYFTGSSEKTQADLDLLMLTQGYRRFEWKALLAGNFPVIRYQPEKALQISGLVTAKGKPVANGRVTLFTTAGGAFVLDTVTNAQGRFAFHNLLFKDSIRFIVQARTAKNSSNVDIVMDRPSAQAPIGAELPADLTMQVTPGFAAYLKSSRQQYQNDVKYGLNGHVIVLKEVVIRDKRPVLSHSSNFNGAGNADQVVKGDIFEQQGCPIVADCLQGRLLGVIFRGGIPYSTRSINRPMQVIVDGAYVSADYLNQINPQDIASIEILRSGGYTAIYGGQGANGVFIINTKRGNEDYTPATYSRYSAGVVTYIPKGFYLSRQFYKPAYGSPASVNTGNDLRTTVDWEPNLLTDKEGNAAFGFYNADAKGTYRVVIEGMDDNGRLGRQVYRYKVE